MSWKVEVIADNSGKWVGNGLRFSTREEAENNAFDLSSRWSAVREIRVLESDDPANYRWDPEKGLARLEPPEATEEWFKNAKLVMPKGGE